MVVCNFTPVVREDYRVGVPAGGYYREILNTDSEIYGGSNAGNYGGAWGIHEPHAGRPFHLTLRAAAAGCGVPQDAANDLRVAPIWRSGLAGSTPFSRCDAGGRLGVMSEITHLLDAAAAGDRQAAADLLPLVYDELRKLAAARMAAENPGHTLDATALVHEAYLRLVGDQHFDGRGHFFAAAAEAMRRVLVNHARDRTRLKRGGGRNRVDLDRLTGPAAATDDDLLELDDALDRLANEFPVAAELVKLRFFAGMTLGDAAEALGIPRRTADRHWAFARAWLADALAGG